MNSTLPDLAYLPRLPDADDRLRSLIIQRLAAPFLWGAHDCALWAADAVHVQIGVDPAGQLRGRYASARHALRLVRGLGGLPSLVTAVLGRPLASPLLARLGDVGHTEEDTLAVCCGDAWAVPTRHGMGYLPLTQATAAWRVGRG